MKVAGWPLHPSTAPMSSQALPNRNRLRSEVLGPWREVLGPLISVEQEMKIMDTAK